MIMNVCWDSVSKTFLHIGRYTPGEIWTDPVVRNFVAVNSKNRVRDERKYVKEKENHRA